MEDSSRIGATNCTRGYWRQLYKQSSTQLRDFVEQLYWGVIIVDVDGMSAEEKDRWLSGCRGLRLQYGHCCPCRDHKYQLFEDGIVCI